MCGERTQDQLLEAVLSCTGTTIINVVTILISLFYFCKGTFNMPVLDRTQNTASRSELTGWAVQTQQFLNSWQLPSLTFFSPTAPSLLAPTCCHGVSRAQCVMYVSHLGAYLDLPAHTTGLLVTSKSNFLLLCTAAGCTNQQLFWKRYVFTPKTLNYFRCILYSQ